MKRNSWKGLGKAAEAFTLGAAAGSLLAILFAPVSGRVARKRIGLKFRSLEQSTARQLRQTKKLLAKKADLLREAATEKLGNTKDWLVHRLGPSNGKRPAHQRVVHHV